MCCSTIAVEARTWESAHIRLAQLVLHSRPVSELGQQLGLQLQPLLRLTRQQRQQRPMLVLQPNMTLNIVH